MDQKILNSNLCLYLDENGFITKQKSSFLLAEYSHSVNNMEVIAVQSRRVYLLLFLIRCSLLSLILSYLLELKKKYPSNYFKTDLK